MYIFANKCRRLSPVILSIFRQIDFSLIKPSREGISQINNKKMKFFRIVSLLFIIMSLAQGQTNEDRELYYNISMPIFIKLLYLVVCSLEPVPVGLCDNWIVGYTYSEIRNRCVIYEARGCEVRGNYFTNRDEWDECKPASTFRTNPFSYYVERYFFQIRNLLKRLFNSNL